MSTSDNSYTTRLRYLSGRTLANFHHNNRCTSIEGPQGTQSSAITLMNQGSGPFIQNRCVLEECCDTIANQSIVPTPTPQPPIPPSPGYYLGGEYSSIIQAPPALSGLLLYNSNQVVAETLVGSTVGNSIAYVTKYDVDGNPVWAARINSDGVGADRADIVTSVGIDPSGNLYAFGTYKGANDITFYNSDTSAGTTLPYSPGDENNANIFIVKYNSTGFVTWATRIIPLGTSVGSVGGISPTGLSIDQYGNIYITGTFDSDIEMYSTSGPTSTLTFTSAGGYDTNIYVIKYNTNGVYQWGTKLTPTTSDSYNEGLDITVDLDGNVIITGFIQTVIEIYSVGNILFGTLTCVNNGVYIVKYNTNGTVLWATKVDSTGSDEGTSVVVDYNLNIYVTGRFDATPVTIFNSDGSPFGTLTSATTSSFVVKYNSNGMGVWRFKIDAGLAIEMNVVTSGPEVGNIYVSGIYLSAVTFFNSNDASSGITRATPGGTPSFIAKYNSAGFALWAARIIPQVTSPSARAVVESISSDSEGNIIGLFTNYSQGGTGVTSIYDSGNINIFPVTPPQTNGSQCFVVKYSPAGLVEFVFRNYGVPGFGFGTCISLKIIAG